MVLKICLYVLLYFSRPRHLLHFCMNIRMYPASTNLWYRNNTSDTRICKLRLQLQAKNQKKLFRLDIGWVKNGLYPTKVLDWICVQFYLTTFLSRGWWCFVEKLSRVEIRRHIRTNILSFIGSDRASWKVCDSARIFPVDVA